MDQLPSAEFRRRFASLTKPVVVTVNGHPIATYTPIMRAIDSRFGEGVRPGEPVTLGAQQPTSSFVQFRPAPKPGRK